MRIRNTLLSKTCPYCGGRSKCEAKLPVASNLQAVEFDLDDLDGLVRRQSLSQLLALVELLPYKTFGCQKCGKEFRMESSTGKELAGTMLRGMRPVAAPAPASARKTVPAHSAPRPEAQPVTPGKGDWEAESLDSLFDYSVDNKG